MVVLHWILAYRLEICLMAVCMCNLRGLRRARPTSKRLVLRSITQMSIFTVRGTYEALVSRDNAQDTTIYRSFNIPGKDFSGNQLPRFCQILPAGDCLRHRSVSIFHSTRMGIRTQKPGSS